MRERGYIILIMHVFIYVFATLSILQSKFIEESHKNWKFWTKLLFLFTLDNNNNAYNNDNRQMADNSYNNNWQFLVIIGRLYCVLIR